jgi:hypothetical protein
MHRGDIIDVDSLPLDAASQQQLLTHKFSLWAPPQVLLVWHETCALKSTVTVWEGQLQTLLRSQVALSTRSDEKQKHIKRGKSVKLQNFKSYCDTEETEKTKEIAASSNHG